MVGGATVVVEVGDEDSVTFWLVTEVTIDVETTVVVVSCDCKLVLESEEPGIDDGIDDAGTGTDANRVGFNETVVTVLQRLLVVTSAQMDSEQTPGINCRPQSMASVV